MIKTFNYLNKPHSKLKYNKLKFKATQYFGKTIQITERIILLKQHSDSEKKFSLAFNNFLIQSEIIFPQK